MYHFFIFLVCHENIKISYISGWGSASLFKIWMAVALHFIDGSSIAFYGKCSLGKVNSRRHIYYKEKTHSLIVTKRAQFQNGTKLAQEADSPTRGPLTHAAQEAYTVIIHPSRAGRKR